MKTKIAILGSCISRDVFNSHFVQNYKDYFELTADAQRTSIISLLQDPLSIDKKLIDIHPDTPKNKARTYFIDCDLKKNFLKKLMENDVDYLIIDNYFEAIFGILYVNNEIITNNFWDLPETEFYKNMPSKLTLKITENFDEFFCIWSKYCDLFFKFLDIYCPDIEVILNQARQTNQVMKSDGTCYIDDNFTRTKNEINPFLEKLDSYIIDNFNIKVIDFDYDNIYCDENHIWGLAAMHFTKNFHETIFEKLICIVNEEKIKQNVTSIKNIYFDEISFEKQLKRTKHETQILLKHMKNSNVSELLKIYNSARIDIKNYGSINNKICLIEKEFPLTRIYFPDWFKSNKGEGIVISSEKGNIDFKFKCVNDGLLRIFLRGPYSHDKNGIRFPIYIDFINFMVNDESIFRESKLVWHDEPYIFEKKVKHSEIIEIHVEWMPFSEYSIIKEKYW